MGLTFFFKASRTLKNPMNLKHSINLQPESALISD